MCVHQCVLFGQRPDFLMAGQSLQFDVMDFVVISDYKKQDLDAAHTETYAYSLLKSRDEFKHPHLRVAMPCMREIILLELHMGIPDKLLSIPIIRAETFTEKKNCFGTAEGGLRHSYRKTVVIEVLCVTETG